MRDRGGLSALGVARRSAFLQTAPFLRRTIGQAALTCKAQRARGQGQRQASGMPKLAPPPPPVHPAGPAANSGVNWPAQPAPKAICPDRSAPARARGLVVASARHSRAVSHATKRSKELLPILILCASLRPAQPAVEAPLAYHRPSLARASRSSAPRRVGKSLPPSAPARTVVRCMDCDVSLDLPVDHKPYGARQPPVGRLSGYSDKNPPLATLASTQTFARDVRS